MSVGAVRRLREASAVSQRKNNYKNALWRANRKNQRKAEKMGRYEHHTHIHTHNILSRSEALDGEAKHATINAFPIIPGAKNGQNPAETKNRYQLAMVCLTPGRGGGYFYYRQGRRIAYSILRVKRKQAR